MESDYKQGVFLTLFVHNRKRLTIYLQALLGP